MTRTMLWACALACLTMPDAGIPSVSEVPQTQTVAPAKSSDSLSALYDENKDRDSRETIIRAAAEHGGDRGKAFLLKIARQDPDVELREVAIRHLAERGETAVLLDLFDAEKDADLKETILRQLAERDDDVSRKKLLEVARSEKNAELRETAVRLLAERGNVAALIALFDAEKDADLKETIVRLLEESNDPKATEKLLAIARSDPDEDVRDAALRVVAERAARRQ